MEMRVILIRSIDFVSLKIVKHEDIVINIPRLTDHLTAIGVFQDQIGNADRECFSVICMDSKGFPTNYSLAHIGTLNNTLISNREIFKVAVKSNASSIIVAHNHPSGDVTPSDEDIRYTKELVRAGRILGIQVLDHIIISAEDGKSIRCYYPHIFE